MLNTFNIPNLKLGRPPDRLLNRLRRVKSLLKTAQTTGQSEKMKNGESLEPSDNWASADFNQEG